MITKTHSVSDIITHNHFLEMVLDRFGIKANEKFQTLEVLSKSKSLELDFLVEILNLFDSEEPFQKDNLNQYSVPVILDYLKRTHKYYLGKRLFEMEHTIQKISQEHVNDLFLSSILNNFFSDYKSELWEHIELEENFLFPHINMLMDAEAGKIDKRILQLKMKNFSIGKFMTEHNDNSEMQLHEICGIIDYLYPTDNCLCPICIFQKQAAGFEKDLKIHALVEDEVLMPKVLALENLVLASI
jgi:regulator of cell morphogenesis and NO signaling